MVRLSISFLLSICLFCTQLIEYKNGYYLIMIDDVKENDEKWYADKNYHTMYIGSIEAVLVRE